MEVDEYNKTHILSMLSSQTNLRDLHMANEEVGSPNQHQTTSSADTIQSAEAPQSSTTGLASQQAHQE